MSTSIDDQERAVAEWRASGLSMAAFARQAGIPYHRLSYWARRSEARQIAVVEDSDIGYFDELPLSKAVVGSDMVMRFEHGGRSVALSVTGAVSAPFLGQVIREVLS